MGACRSKQEKEFSLLETIKVKILKNDMEGAAHLQNHVFHEQLPIKKH